MLFFPSGVEIGFLHIFGRLQIAPFNAAAALRFASDCRDRSLRRFLSTGNTHPTFRSAGRHRTSRARLTAKGSSGHATRLFGGVTGQDIFTFVIGMAQHGEPVAGHVPECFGHAFQLGFFQVWINIFPCYCEDTLFLRSCELSARRINPSQFSGV